MCVDFVEQNEDLETPKLIQFFFKLLSVDTFLRFYFVFRLLYFQ